MIFNKQLLQLTIQRSEEKGIAFATYELLKDLGVTSVSKKEELPAKGPLLIISNHPGVFDSLLLFSQIERNDLHFVALSTYEIFGPKIKERLLPIYRLPDFNHRIYEYPLCLQMTGRAPENVTESEIRVRNKQTIRKAANLLNNGKAVSIFPAGSAGKHLADSHWKAGIGFLVKQITNPRTQIVFSQIQGTRPTDLIAYMHPIIRTLLFKPRPISIHFSPPELLSKLVKPEDDGKTIAKKLEKAYQSYWK